MIVEQHSPPTLIDTLTRRASPTRLERTAQSQTACIRGALRCILRPAFNLRFAVRTGILLGEQFYTGFSTLGVRI